MRVRFQIPMKALRTRKLSVIVSIVAGHCLWGVGLQSTFGEDVSGHVVLNS